MCYFAVSICGNLNLKICLKFNLILGIALFIKINYHEITTAVLHYTC